MELIRYVDVYDDDGLPYCFGPGEVVPSWAVERITNPDVWASSPSVGATPAPATEPEETVSQEPAVDPEPEDLELEVEGDEDGEPAGDGEVERPRGNATRGAWIEYAESLGITVPADAQRNDIIELVDAKD